MSLHNTLYNRRDHPRFSRWKVGSEGRIGVVKEGSGDKDVALSPAFPARVSGNSKYHFNQRCDCGNHFAIIYTHTDQLGLS